MKRRECSSGAWDPSAPRNGSRVTHQEQEEAVAKFLVERGVLTDEGARDLTGQADKEACSFEDMCLRQGVISAKELNRAIEEVTGAPAVDPSGLAVGSAFMSSISRIISKEDALRLDCFPLRIEKGDLHVVTTAPADDEAVSRITALTGCRVKVSACHAFGIRKAIEQHYDGVPPPEEDQSIERLAELAAYEANKVFDDVRAGVSGALDKLVSNPTVIHFVTTSMRDMISAGVSDMHMEILADGVRVRGRLDGVLVTFGKYPPALGPALVARVKSMARLDMDVTGAVQEGRIGFNLVEGRDIDLRVSIVPGSHGEKVVMRVLDRTAVTFTIDDIGFPEDRLAMIKKRIEAPNGLVLVTGPTGSGKSTTLYAFLRRLNREDRCVLTLEEPVEYDIAGATQVHCDSDSGMSFADTLRAFLRQDPDIIMVGEIRDLETADVALKAALTGHLVLSTLHTNDAAGTVIRLLNMDVEPYLLAEVLRLIVAQRLVRRLCADCRAPAQPSAEVLGLLELAPGDVGERVLYDAVGCPSCRNTGYRGRLPIFEILDVDDRLARLVAEGANQSALEKEAVAQGMQSLRENALERAFEGTTSLAEVFRVTI